MMFSRNSHRFFLHRLQQCRLCLGRHAVNFIGEHEIAKHRTGLEIKELSSILILRDDVGADDVSGHQIGRELNAGTSEV